MVTLSPSPRKRVRVGMLSLGCPKTLVDSELVLGKLDRHRYTVASSVARCDVAILNTCAFIQEAQQESVDHLLQLLELKKEGQIQKVVVLGCLTQRFLPELEKELKGVDAYVGTGDYAKIPEILEQVTGGSRVSSVGLPGYLYTSAENRIRLTPRHFRYVKISEGCDHTCSFCVIPSFRGGHRSRLLEDVVKEAQILVSEGARELILTGQDTTFYGYDTDGRFLLSELLRRLNEIQGLRWVRLLYAYPSLVNEDLIESIASLEKVCHYLDMPLQHVSDRILKSMRRGTTSSAAIRRLLERLRKRIPDLAIRTTFIVGYPGETDEDFEELLNFMREAQFERLGIFTYSQEEGSLAATLPSQVPEKLKRERVEEGMRIQQEISEKKNQEQLGKILEVLIDEKAREPRTWAGRSYMDAPEVDGSVQVKLSPRKNESVKPRPGDFLKVKVTGAHAYDLLGTAEAFPLA